MNQEQQDRLVEYLKSLGFRGDRLEDDLKQQIAFSPSRFIIKHHVDLGEARMIYDLHFERDMQFNAYRLERYHATMRRSVTIPQDNEEGINTEALELRMQQFDWDKYFANPDYNVDDHTRQSINNLTEELDTLTQLYGDTGNEISQLLMYKYWPKQVYEAIGTRKDFARAYEKSQVFSAGINGICSAPLAYYHVSGILENIYEQINATSLTNLLSLDFYTALENNLKSTPDQFTITHLHHEENDFGTFEMPINRSDEHYAFETYAIKYSSLPKIAHCTIDGIDTAALESELRSINWKSGTGLFVSKTEVDVVPHPNVSQVITQLEQLQHQQCGAQIANLLMLKYWSDAEVFKTLIPAQAWQLLESLPAKTHSFPTEIDAFAAWNMMTGRVVKEDLVYKFSIDNGNWLGLVQGYNTPAGQGEINIMATDFSREQLLSGLQQLPIKNTNSFMAVDYLLERGSIASVTLNNGIEVLLRANPAHKTIDVFTPQMIPVPVNLNFDPNWKPSTELGQQTKISQERTQNNRVSTNKNLHLRKGRRPGL